MKSTDCFASCKRGATVNLQERSTTKACLQWADYLPSSVFKSLFSCFFVARIAMVLVATG